jgi:glycosyltransferase involved in cell wall biosynthesis
MKILIVSPYYPPDSSVAVVRMASLSRYLVTQGHEVSVMRNRIEKGKDFSNQLEIPSGVNTYQVDSTTEGSYFKKFHKDYQNYKKKIDGIFSKENFDVVIISVGPFHTLPLCKYIKNKFKVKCIIDFRDLWVFDIRGFRDFLKIKRLIAKVISYPKERSAIKYADKIITVTEGWKNRMVKFYPSFKSKFNIIHNGYDDILLSDIEVKAEIDNSKIVLGVFGKLSYYSKKYSYKFFESVNMNLREGNNFEILQVGTLEKETMNIMDSINYPKEKFHSTGFIDYKEGMQLLSNARVCILIDIRKAGLGTKIYDYIFLNKPVIYIGKKRTDLANFVNSFENGYVCDTEIEISNAIGNILKNNIYKLGNDVDYKRFGRSVQNAKFSSIIKSLVES